MRLIFVAVLLVASCSSETSGLRTDAAPDPGSAHGDGAAGAGGSSNAAGASGSAGSGPSAGANGADAGGRGGSSNGGTGGIACIPYNTQTFALNVDQACGDAGRCLPDNPRCCYAHCELQGAPFVGCADNAPGLPPSQCYASCAACP